MTSSTLSQSASSQLAQEGGPKAFPVMTGTIQPKLGVDEFLIFFVFRTGFACSGPTSGHCPASTPCSRSSHACAKGSTLKTGSNFRRMAGKFFNIVDEIERELALLNPGYCFMATAHLERSCTLTVKNELLRAGSLRCTRCNGTPCLR